MCLALTVLKKQQLSSCLLYVPHTCNVWHSMANRNMKHPIPLTRFFDASYASCSPPVCLSMRIEPFRERAFFCGDIKDLTPISYNDKYIKRNIKACLLWLNQYSTHRHLWTSRATYFRWLCKIFDINYYIPHFIHGCCLVLQRSGCRRLTQKMCKQ